MENKNSQVVAERVTGALGRGLATEPAPIDVPDSARYIVEKSIMISPTFDIVIKARQVIVVRGRDVEVEVDHFGLSLRAGDTELIIDPRYNSAELRRRDKLVAMSDKVRYRWVRGPVYEQIYEAKDFANLIRNAVKEIIEEAINITAFS